MAVAKSRGRIWFGGPDTQHPITIQRANDYLTRFGNMLDSAGGSVLIRTSDTGQYVPGSYSSGNTYGYFVYAWHSYGSVVYIKFSFERFSNIYPVLTVSIGTSTNGSGTITGTAVEFTRCLSFERAPSSNTPYSGIAETYEFDFFASVSEDGVYFSSQGTGAYETSGSDIRGSGIFISRLLTIDESGVDTNLVLFQSYIGHRNGINTNATRFYHTVVNMSSGSKELANEYSSNSSTESTSIDPQIHLAKSVYAIPFLNHNSLVMVGNKYPSKIVRVPTSNGMRRSTGTIAVPYTGTNDLIYVDGRRYLRTTLFWNGNGYLGSDENNGNNTTTSMTNSCLAYLYEE